MRNLFYIAILFITTIFYSCTDHIVESTPSIDQIMINNNSVSATFSDIQNKVFNKSCALSGCHITGVQSPDLSGNSINRIVNIPSSKGMSYIKPGLPLQSYLYLKLLGSSNISGSRMPKNSPSLSQPVLDSISTWISKGALNN